MSIHNIVNMAQLKGLEIIALTDHNSCKNCPAFLDVAKEAGILALPGMEINTMEEVHAVCLFKKLENAMAFDEYIYAQLANIKNQPDIFGQQLLLNAQDDITGEVEKLLINATGISFFDLGPLMKEYGGIYFPAHIEKSAFSLIANLGFVPPGCDMHAFELYDASKHHEITRSNPPLKGLPLLINSDAHYLTDISEATNVLPESIKRLLL
jgi:PHP family Zn ribbon phosphoesterase